MTTMYVLDVPENASLADLVQADSALAVDRIGPYYAISNDGDITIDRRASGCRHAVWYSVVAGIARGGRIVQHDREALRVIPDGGATGA
jgi:hypothetical protein